MMDIFFRGNNLFLLQEFDLEVFYLLDLLEPKLFRRFLNFHSLM